MKAGNVNGAEFVSRLGDQVLFQPPLRPHEQYFDLWVLLRHQLRHGNSRVHMARRAAAGKNHIHERASYPFSGAGICRETLSTMPISASWHSRAVPP